MIASLLLSILCYFDRENEQLYKNRLGLRFNTIKKVTNAIYDDEKHLQLQQASL